MHITQYVINNDDDELPQSRCQINYNTDLIGIFHLFQHIIGSPWWLHDLHKEKQNRKPENI